MKADVISARIAVTVNVANLSPYEMRGSSIVLLRNTIQKTLQKLCKEVLNHLAKLHLLVIVVLQMESDFKFEMQLHRTPPLK